MRAKTINPILNVANMQQSFEWFRKLGWEKEWEWGRPRVPPQPAAGDKMTFVCTCEQ